jgi:hypothetical protein
VWIKQGGMHLQAGTAKRTSVSGALVGRVLQLSYPGLHRNIFTRAHQPATQAAWGERLQRCMTAG